MLNNRELISLDPRRQTSHIEEVHRPNPSLVEYINNLKSEHRYFSLRNSEEVANLIKGKSHCSMTPRDEGNYMEWFMTNIFHRLKYNVFKPSNNTNLDLTAADNVFTTVVGKIAA